MGNALGLVRDSEGYVVCGDWGAQPDSDMKVYFAEIGIGKIGNFGISDFLPKISYFSEFWQNWEQFFWNFLFLLKVRYSYEATYAPKRSGEEIMAGREISFIRT